VMGSVDTRHAGVASGINNAVSRIAGLLAIAVFGVVLLHGFTSRVQPALPRMSQQEVANELPKMAGAHVRDAQAQRAIHQAFVGSFRVVMIQCAVLALLSGIAGLGTPSTRRKSRTPA
jgi:hypothetical protein